jgi:hypothetical protein
MDINTIIPNTIPSNLTVKEIIENNNKTLLKLNNNLKNLNDLKK